MYIYLKGFLTPRSFSQIYLYLVSIHILKHFQSSKCIYIYEIEKKRFPLTILVDIYLIYRSRKSLDRVTHRLSQFRKFHKEEKWLTID